MMLAFRLGILGSYPARSLYSCSPFVPLLFSPLPAKPKGTLGLHSVHLSVHPSVSPSVSPEYQFSGLFSYTLADIDRNFGMKVNHHDLQIKFEFCYAPLIFGEITGFGLSKFQ